MIVMTRGLMVDDGFLSSLSSLLLVPPGSGPPLFRLRLPLPLSPSVAALYLTMAVDLVLRNRSQLANQEESATLTCPHLPTRTNPLSPVGLFALRL